MLSVGSHGLEKDSENSKDSGGMPLPKVLRWFWIGSVGAFALTLLVACLEFRAGMNQYRWSGFDTPYFRDLIQDVPTFRMLHTAAFFDPANPSPVAYPPFGAIQLGLLYGSGHPVTFFLLLAVTALGFAVWGVRRALVENGIDRRVALLFPLTLALVSFPIERLVVQGNIEIFLWIFTAAGVWAYLRDHDDVAAILWGLAAASKLYPVVLLVLLLPRRKFRAFSVGSGCVRCGLSAFPLVPGAGPCGGVEGLAAECFWLSAVSRSRVEHTRNECKSLVISAGRSLRRRFWVYRR